MMTKTKPRVEDLAPIAESLYRYARRWVVAQAPAPADAIIYDAVVKVLNTQAQPHWESVIEPATAVTDRHLRYGPEPHAAGFTIPTTVVDATVALHRFARRYTNGRGTTTAAVVNQAARDLLALGVDLGETQRTDGTIWAADGAEGAHDGLSAAERAEALAVVQRD